MIYNEEDIKLFDYANIPVDIWLTPLEKDHELYFDGYLWCLRIGNYMPRKGRVTESAVSIYSDNKEELQALVRDHIIPIYQNAMNKLQNIVEGKSDNLYYWDKPDEDSINEV